jgi:A/G-specific DNA glycosylase
MRRNISRRAAIVNALEEWFERNQRPLPWRAEYDPYHVLVSEMMLQQTRMEVVLDYFPRFIAKFPTVEALARAPEFEVLASWSGLGYYRRARMLRSAAIAISELHGGVVPDDEELLAKLPGIGRYTAGAVASIAFDRKAAVVEGNVTRLLARVDAIDAPVESAALRNELWKTAADLVALARSPRNFNQAMMEYGALVCRSQNPRCDECVIAKHCRGESRTAELPARRQSSAVKRLLIPLYLVSDSRGRILMRRESGTLMSEMFHLPHGDTSLLPGEVLDVDPGAPLGRFTHTVTNRRIEFVVHDAELRAGVVRDSSGEYRWVDPRALRSVPHPSYVKKALRLAGWI